MLPRIVKFLGYSPQPQTGITLAERMIAKRYALGWSKRMVAKKRE